MGDALLQKTYTVDLLEKKRAANHGEVPQYYVKHSHEAIIAEQVFLEVKAEIARRSALKKKSNGRRCYTYKNALTSVLIYSNASKESMIVCVENFIEDDDWNFADILTKF